MVQEVAYRGITHSNMGAESILVPGLPSVRLGAFAEIRSTDCDGFVSIDKYSTVNRAVVGAYFGVACQSYVGRCRAGRYIEIGSRCSIAPFNHPTEWLSSGVFQYKDPRSCWDAEASDGYHLDYEPEKAWTILGSDVWVGDNAVVLAGVTVGTGAVIAAGSVVTKDVAPYSIVVGNPARHLRFRFDEATQQRLMDSHWWDLPIESLTGVDFSNIHTALDQLDDRVARPER